MGWVVTLSVSEYVGGIGRELEGLVPTLREMLPSKYFRNFLDKVRAMSWWLRVALAGAAVSICVSVCLCTRVRAYVCVCVQFARYFVPRYLEAIFLCKSPINEAGSQQVRPMRSPARACAVCSVYARESLQLLVDCHMIKQILTRLPGVGGPMMDEAEVSMYLRYVAKVRARGVSL